MDVLFVERVLARTISISILSDIDAILVKINSQI
jgi:hypothetical protein